MTSRDWRRATEQLEQSMEQQQDSSGSVDGATEHEHDGGDGRDEGVDESERTPDDESLHFLPALPFDLEGAIAEEIRKSECRQQAAESGGDRQERAAESRGDRADERQGMSAAISTTVASMCDAEEQQGTAAEAAPETQRAADGSSSAAAVQQGADEATGAAAAGGHEAWHEGDGVEGATAAAASGWAGDKRTRGERGPRAGRRVRKQLADKAGRAHGSD